MSVNDILSALSDENRRKILEILAQSLQFTPQALSYHLKKLKKADLIYETKEKNFIYYELNLTVLEEAIVWMNSIIGGK